MLSSEARWREGVPLGEAFDALGDTRQREEFRKPKPKGALEVEKELMFADLFKRLSSEDLLAYGFRTSPEPSADPVLLPSHCFEQRPNIADCESDTVMASEISYERVRIISALDSGNTDTKIEGIYPAKLDIIDPATGKTGPNERSENQEPDSHRVVPEKRGRGRPSLEAAVMSRLQELYDENPVLLRKPAGALVGEFNVGFQHHAEEVGRNEKTVSDKTLRKYLERFWKKLEENPHAHG